MTTAKKHSPVVSAIEIERARQDFPILSQKINGHRLAFLDSAASSQRPKSVIEALRHYDEKDHANVHRGVHTLSHRATEAYEGAREKVRRFINAESVREIIFTSGTTGAINLVASSLGAGFGPKDEILISHLEHHSNIVPWQMLCERSGATLQVAPINDRGEIDLDGFSALLSSRTRLVAISHVSNALGTVNPVAALAQQARAAGALVLIDGAQAVPHQTVDVQAIDCDFYAFSGHKMYGPTGIGVLYAREKILQDLPPYQGGGDMILTVSFNGTTYNELPYRFEAGTPNISGAIGLGAAIDYLEGLGMEAIGQHEANLLAYATEQIGAIQGITLIGTAEEKAGVVSFNLKDIHPHDLGTVVDQKGVAIRTGHHCAMPVMDFFGISGTARASLGLYNCREDIDQLVDAVQLAIRMFK